LTRGDYIAFISSNSTALPPTNTQANSNVVSLGFSIIIPADGEAEQQ
jgi:hypothetical protein